MGLQNHAIGTLEQDLPELKLRSGYELYFIDTDIMVVEVYAEDEAQEVLDALRAEFNPEVLDLDLYAGMVIKFLPLERWTERSREII